MSGATTASRAESFIQSIGANQHIGYFGTVYSNVSLELQEISYLGTSLIRDQAPSTASLSLYQQLASNGLKFDLITSPAGQDLNSTLPTDIAEISALAQSNPGSVLSVEGPNELNGGQIVYLNGAVSNTASVGSLIVQDVSRSVRSNATLSAQNVKVVNISINNGGSGWQAYVAGLGNLDAYVDDANWHVYFNNGSQPESVVLSMYQDAEQSAPGKPVLFTEAGYTTAIGAQGVGVDEATQAKNTLNLLADAYKAGVQQTYLYELMDGVANPSSFDTENNFGVFNANGTPKQSATAIHNLTSVLADTAGNATNFVPGTLNYSISNLPGTGNSLLLEKASGAFDLMVWNEPPDWNAGSESEINVSPVSVTVNLGATYAAVEVFDPTKGSSPIQTLSNVSSVTLSLTDHPLVIEVEPMGGPSAAPPPSTTPSPDNTVVKAGSTGTITDASGNQWTITAGGQVAVNGAADATTTGVIELAYENGLVWQENANALWWSKSSPSAAWAPSGGTSTSPVTATPTPTPTPTPTSSPNNTVVKAGSSSAITDASGNQWTITAGGQVAVNGAADATTRGVIELAYENGLVWQENANALWWSKSSPSAAWAPSGGTATSPVTATPTPTPAPTPAPTPTPTSTASPDNTVVKAGSTSAITDASGNQWTITAGGQVAVNGAADATTRGVIELAYENGLVWQENANALWWSKSSPSAAWAPSGGTATSPVTATLTPTPAPTPTPTPTPTSTASPDNTVVLAGSTSAITDASGNQWTITAGGQVAVNGATDATTRGVIELAYEKGMIWQENANALWWSKSSPSAAWAPSGGTSTSPVTATPTPTPTPTPSPTSTASPNNTVVLAGSTNAITDASGNRWTITAGGQVAVNGVADTTTASVAELDYTNGLIWQENSRNLWWSKGSPAAVWNPAGGTAAPPISITLTNQATGATTTVDATKVHSETDYGATFSLTAPGVAQVTLGTTATRLAFTGLTSIALTAGPAAATVVADGGANTFTSGTGILDVAGGAGADAYVYHSGNALLTIEDFSAAKGDTLTIDSALNSALATSSDGQGGTLLSFGSAAAGIDLKGVEAAPTSSIHWA